jgi:type VI secretion system secreted protein VgrG
MATLEASTARFLLEGEKLEWKDLMVADLVGREAISQPFRFDLRLVSTNRKVAFEDVLNKPVTLTLMREEGEEKVHGLIVDFSQGGFADKKHVFYQAVLVPRLWLLGLSYQSRVYQNVTVQDIVTDVLKQAGFGSDDTRWSLKRKLPTREHVAQYRETDLDFVSRLLEHEGIFYFFDHQGDKEVLVISDDVGQFPALSAPDEVPFRAASGMAGDVPEHVDGFVLRERLVTGKVLLRDYNYRTPELNLQAESQLNRNGIGVFYEYGDHFKNVDEGGQLARLRNEEIECMRVVGRGRSDVRGFRAGACFTLGEHFRDDWNQKYLLIEVEHRGSQSEALGVGSSASGTSSYQNDFTCIPATAPYRPPRITAQPRLPGVWTAKIESPGGPYAHLDDQGRYRVRMPFDLGGSGKASASKAVRMATPYAGPGYGFHAPVHEGVEMVMACVDGNVDRPLGLGVASNPAQMTPSASGNKAQSVFRSASGNELRMDDTGGSMEMFLNASKDMKVTVANDQAIEVAANRTMKVGTNLDESVGSNMTLKVSGNESEEVTGNVEIKVGGNVTETVTGNVSTTISGSRDTTIAASDSEKIGGTKDVTVGGAFSIKSAAMSLACSSLTLTSGGGMNMEGSGSGKEKIGGSKSITVGMNFKVAAGAKVSFEGDSIALKAGDKVSLKANAIEIEAATKITLKCAGSTIELGPSGVSIKSAAIVQIQGSLVKIN